MEETKLIELADGTLIEVSVRPGEVRQISGGLAEKVASGFDKVSDLIARVCNPVFATCMEMSKTTKVDQAEIELGLSFEAEGNVYITKVKGRANLTVKFIVRFQ
jgi:hypothetical protein